MILLDVMLVALLMALIPLAARAGRDYTFDGPPSQQVIENYLSRSIEYLGLCSESDAGPAPYFEDNLRLIRNTGAKFIGRAAYAWDCPKDDDRHFQVAAEYAKRLHQVDPEIVLQACVFETTYSRAARGADGYGIEDIPIPDWVFHEFGLSDTPRNFRYEAMLFPDGRSRDVWGPGASVPDIRQLETQLWFFYRAKRYIDAGYEAIHFGQAGWIGMDDTDHSVWAGLLARVRRYAASHARRHWVLCDAHIATCGPNPCLYYNGTLLWDLVGYPLRPMEGIQPLSASLQVGWLDALYQRVPGGRHPAGWMCEVLPQYYEFDNCQTGLSTDGGIFVWGADEATWFANLPEADRNRWLAYAWRWIWNNAPSGYLSMPGRRPALTPVWAPKRWMYILNTPSDACPDGFGQEETVKGLWSDRRYMDNAKRPKRPANPKSVMPGPRLLLHWDFTQSTRRTGDGALFIENRAGKGLEGMIKRNTLARLQAVYQAFGGAASRQERTNAYNVLRDEERKLRALLVRGRNEKAMHFDGSAVIQAHQSFKLHLPVLSLACWMKIDHFDTSLFPVDKSEWMRSGWYVKYHQPADEFYVEVFDGGSERRVAHFTGIEPGAWTHLAFIVDGTHLSAHVNGMMTERVLAGAPIENSLPLVVGRSCSGLSLRDLRLWSGALSPGQVVELSRGAAR